MTTVSAVGATNQNIMSNSNNDNNNNNNPSASNVGLNKIQSMYKRMTENDTFSNDHILSAKKAPGGGGKVMSDYRALYGTKTSLLSDRGDPAIRPTTIGNIRFAPYRRADNRNFLFAHTKDDKAPITDVKNIMATKYEGTTQYMHDIATRERANHVLSNMRLENANAGLGAPSIFNKDGMMDEHTKSMTKSEKAKAFAQFHASTMKREENPKVKQRPKQIIHDPIGWDKHMYRQQVQPDLYVISKPKGTGKSRHIPSSTVNRDIIGVHTIVRQNDPNEVDETKMNLTMDRQIGAGRMGASTKSRVRSAFSGTVPMVQFNDNNGGEDNIASSSSILSQFSEKDSIIISDKAGTMDTSFNGGKHLHLRSMPKGPIVGSKWKDAQNTNQEHVDSLQYVDAEAKYELLNKHVDQVIGGPNPKQPNSVKASNANEFRPSDDLNLKSDDQIAQIAEHYRFFSTAPEYLSLIHI